MPCTEKRQGNGRLNTRVCGIGSSKGLQGSSRMGMVLMQVTVWFPAQFAELRRICLSECGGEAAFCASLSRCHRYDTASRISPLVLRMHRACRHLLPLKVRGTCWQAGAGAASLAGLQSSCPRHHSVC